MNMFEYSQKTLIRTFCLFWFLILVQVIILSKTRGHFFSLTLLPFAVVPAAMAAAAAYDVHCVEAVAVAAAAALATRRLWPGGGSVQMAAQAEQVTRERSFAGQPAGDGAVLWQKLQVSFDCDPHVVFTKAGESRILIYLRNLRIIQLTY